MNKLKRPIEVILVTLFSTLVLMVSWQVFSRYILADPATVTEELSRFLLIWLIFFGATYTFIEKGHLSFELFYEKYEDKFYLKKVVSFLVLFLGLIIFLGGSNLVYTVWSLGQKTPVLEMPIAIVYIVAPLNGLLILLYGAQEFLKGSR